MPAPPAGSNSVGAKPLAHERSTRGGDSGAKTCLRNQGMFAEAGHTRNKASADALAICWRCVGDALVMCWR